MSGLKDDLSHSLYHEFPEFHDLIEKLKITDSVFAEKAAMYHKLDHRIRGLENGGVPTTDDVYVDLKKQRIHLKDDLYKTLNAF